MRLPTLQSPRQMYSIVALHRLHHLESLLGIDASLADGAAVLKDISKSLLGELAPHSSGIIADPNLSFPLLLDQDKEPEHGLVLTLTAADTTALPQLFPFWGVDEVANNYAVAHLPLQYHPAEILAAEKKKLVAELDDTCQHMNVDLILELTILSQPDQPDDPALFQESQLQAINELQSMADMLVLQFPGDALAAATLTTELDIPWIVSLSGQDYQQVKQQVRTALENGAQGFVAGSILWQDIGQLKLPDMRTDFDAVTKFIQTTARDRVIELNRITNEFGNK